MDRKLVFSLSRDSFEWDYFRAGGKGGQAQNKSSTGVRCKHKPSGAVGEARDARGQLENKRNAFKRCCLTDKFQLWVRLQASDLPAVEDAVNSMLENDKIKIEVKDKNGRWTEVESIEYK